jgi:hypothetical protein
MAEVVLEGEEPNGLAQMLAGLVEANLASNPTKARLLESARGAAQITVSDAGVTIGLKFVPGTLTVTSGPVPGADIRIATDAETLMSLSTVPLRAGLPDLLQPQGRQAAAGALTGRLKVRGLPMGLPILRLLNRVLNVA